MKKSKLFLIIGIIFILIAFIGDAIISSTVLDFSDSAALEIGHYVCIGVTALSIIAGIVFIVVSRKIEKKENQ